MKTINKLMMVLFTVLVSTSALADIAVVVHPSNAAAIEPGEIEKIFLAKTKSFPDGSQAVPINQAEGSSTRTAFDEGLLNKSAAQLKAYWSKLVFTGKGTPPKDVDSDAEVKSLIAANPNMIGYIAAGSADASVKVIHRF